MERYDVIISGGANDRKISNAVWTDFTGSIPLNCTSGGGGRGCSCEKTTPPTIPPVTESPVITSLSPTSIMPWSFLTINGRSLTNVVQFFDSNGNKNIEVGQGGGNQTTIRVPRYLTPGNYTVKIYKTADSISNSKPLIIRGKLPPTIPTIPTTSSWTPPQTINGWWSQLSPDGKYVSYGNWGESWAHQRTSPTNRRRRP